MPLPFPPLRQALQNKGIRVQSEDRGDNRLLLRFSDTEQQLQAFEVGKQTLDGRHVVALNLATSMPGWLRSIGASPMNLGLDLRGGVQFLATGGYESGGRKSDQQLCRIDQGEPARSQAAPFFCNPDRE